MAFDACLTEIQKAAGRDLSDTELDDLLSELQRRQRVKELENAAGDQERASRETADEYARELAQAAMIEKRNAAINLKRRMEALDFVRSQFAGDEALGVEAFLVGVNRARTGSRRSAAAAQNSLRDRYVAGFMADVEASGLWREFVSGVMDRDIARALWARNRNEALPTDAPREAAQIADTIAKWQEVSRRDANRAGAWIKKQDGYIVRQSHDVYKVRAAGYDAWRTEILPRLDMDRTFDGHDPEEVLPEIYEGLASGIHMKAQSRATGFKGGRNLAKKLSQERVLHFKTADDWFEYNQRFGTTSLREAVFRGLDLSAQNTGLMSRLGTNPEANLQSITDEITRGVKDPIKKRQFADAAKGKLANQLKELDGTTRTPVNAMGARIASSTRVVQRMAKLGGSVLSQFGDIPLYASEMRYQGQGMLGSMTESIGNLFRGRGSKERREMAGMLGVVSDTMKSDATIRASIADDDLPGSLSRAQQFFFKWNLMAPWTDRQRSGAIFAMSHRLAMNKNTRFDNLDPDLQRVLGLYAIGRGEWDIIRSASTKQADGREYVVPEAIMEVPDERFSAHLQGMGVKPTTAKIGELRNDLASSLRSYYTDRSMFATIMPDQRTRAMMLRGTQPGSVEGELMRFLGELKAFAFSVIQKSLGREVYGRGSDTFAQAIRNGNGELIGLANVMLWTTLFGYLAMSSKDLVKGRTPRDPDDPKTWMAAFTQGGGAGIYGDFLFGEVKNRYGGGLLSTLAGPTLGTVEDIADLYGRARDGDDLASAALRTTISNTPFANLFYTRMALDYLVLWQIQEALNPGAMRRMERNIERENAQSFLIRPSQAVQ